VFRINLLPIVMFMLALGGFALHTRYIKPAAQERLAAWAAQNWRSLILANLVFMLALIFFGGVIHAFMMSHPAILYFACALILFVIIEVVATLRQGKKTSPLIKK
jgi:hypothetical protein